MRLPEFVEFVRAENAAASMSRGLKERTDSWGRLVAHAQFILSEVQNELARTQIRFSPEQFYEAEQGAPLIAASRVLDAASQVGNIESSYRQRLALCAAAAFSMYGNFPSARAAIKNALDISVPESSWIWLAIGFFSPRLISRARQHSIESSNRLVSAILEDLQSFLVTGDERKIDLVDRKIVNAFKTRNEIIENLLLGYARVSLRHLQVLSTQGSLSSFSGLPRSVITNLIDAGILTLLPSQFSVLCKSPLLRSSGNALVCLPTSTGKTLIGEITIAASLGSRPGLAIYLAPYIALGLQVAHALKEHLPPSYRVHTLVGGFTTDVPIDSSSFPEIIVTTPERLDAILRRLNALDDLRIVVVDEAHLVSDGTRGVRLEALLSRLRLQQENGRAFRIVCLSAVMAESARFRRWLNVSDDLFVTCFWRPTARRVALWRNNNRLTWLYAGDELRPPDATPTSIFGTKNLTWPARMYAASNFGQIKSQASALYENAGYLCRQMYEEYRQPVLCVCASRPSSRGVAYRLAGDMEPYEVVPDELNDAIAFIDEFAPHLFGLKECLIRGVAFHNAALPVSLRQRIEKAVTARVLKVVCATTTLAEGVDLPFRVTILAEWLQWRLDTRDRQKPFGALKFRNIAGRSGRAGVFTEGDTIVFENVLGPEKFIDHQNRVRSILSMLERPNEVNSALEEDVVSNELEARRRVVTSQFLAVISENPSDSAIEESFASRLLVRELHNGQTAQQLTTACRDEVLSGGEMAFAKAASPLRLTPLGEAARQTLFSPESCRTIINELREMPEGRDFDYVSAHLLERLGAIPEQRNSDWSKMVSSSRSRFVVKPRDLQLVLSNWRATTDLPEIFVQLPTVKNSKAQEPVSEWLAGRRISENWSNQYDKFSDFVGDVLEEFLPWIIDACSRLSPYAMENTTGYPWEEFRATVKDTLEFRRREPET